MKDKYFIRFIRILSLGICGFLVAVVVGVPRPWPLVAYLPAVAYFVYVYVVTRREE